MIWTIASPYQLERRRLRLSHQFVLAMLTLGTAACHDLEADSPMRGDPVIAAVPAVSLPAPSGNHRVGRRFVIWEDAARHRSVPVWFYYPAWAPDSVTEPVLTDSLWRVLHRSEIARRLGRGPASALVGLQTLAQSNAPLEATLRPFPVLLFAPASGWLPTDYSALLEGLASRGYVVVAFAPPGDAATIRLPHGTLIPLADVSEVSHERVAEDFAFVARMLRSAADGPGMALRDQLDLSHIGVVGQGMGGTAAFLAAASDSLFSAAANLDGDFLLTGTALMPRQPLLYFSSQPLGLRDAPIEQWPALDRGEQRRDEMWNALRTDSRVSIRAQVIGMRSGNFLDAALLPRSLTQGSQLRVGFGEIDGERGIALATGVLDNFFAGALNGSRATFRPTTNQYPELRMTW